VSPENQTVRDIMLSLSGFPCLKENSTVQDAIKQLRTFCPIGSSGPCGFNELMVVDDQGCLIGRVTQQGILKVLFSTLFDTTDIKRFEGKTVEYSDLTTLLNGVMIKEGVNHLNSPLTRVIEKGIRVLPTTAGLVHAMSVMVNCQEMVLPVEENDKLVGVVKLSEVFGALGDKLISLKSK
jgi:predicted transcriptional regulator